ncbi:MAG: transposase [Methanomethylovorans sp.]|uniref:transposase n=1 Tax=Methanomethylovorans sp. TaxID=2758717 RepID=UPI000AADABFB|nr:transposase [Methanomethylovorans sp.]
MKDEGTNIEVFNDGTQPEEELIEVCPICGCAELYYEAGGIEGLYHCKHCGYIGAFVIDANKEMMELIQKEYDASARDAE